MPAFVKVCQECGWELYRCPTCGDLCCRCPVYWSGGRRQHYDKTGKPYELAPHLRRTVPKEAKTGLSPASG